MDFKYKLNIGALIVLLSKNFMIKLSVPDCPFLDPINGLKPRTPSDFISFRF